MTNFKSNILLFFFVLIFKYGSSQNYLDIRGIVVDSGGIVLSNATVRLLSGNDTLFSITGEAGYFHFRRMKQRSFEIRVTLAGYRDYIENVIVDPLTSLVQMRPIILKVKFTELEKAIVTPAKSILIKQDTVEYHADLFLTRNGEMLEGLIKKLPGIRVDMNSNVSVQGTKIAYLLVNGRPFFGGDVSLALQNLPADIVDKVQVINEYGDQAKLTGIKNTEPRKVLNIELKKDKRNGEFGNALVGTGAKERYSVSAFVNRFKIERQISAIIKQNNCDNGGAATRDTKYRDLRLNYNDRWGSNWSGSGGLSLNQLNQTLENSLFGNAYLAGQNTTQNINSFNTGENFNLQSNYLFQFIPSSSALFSIEPSFSVRQNRGASSSTFFLLQRDIDSSQRESKGVSDTRANGTGFSESIKLYFQRIGNKVKRRIGVSISLKHSKEISKGINTIKSKNSISSISDSSLQYYLISNDNSVADLGTELNYYEPIGKRSFVEFNYSFERTSTEEDKSTKVPNNTTGFPIVIDSMSSYFLRRSTVHKVHIGYVASIDKLNLTLAIDARPTTLANRCFNKDIDTSYSFINFNPVGQFSYNFSATHRINFGYNGNIRQPSPYQLQPVISVDDPQFPVVGNPRLKHEIEHSINTHYEHLYYRGSKYFGFSVTLQFTQIQNKIISKIIHPHDITPVVQKTTYINTNGFYSWRVNLHLDLPTFFNKSLKIAGSTELGRMNSLSAIDSITYSISNLNYVQSVDMYYTLKEKLEFNLSLNYSLNAMYYKANADLPGQSSLLSLKMGCRTTLTSKWAAGYSFSQSFTSGFQQSFTSNPALLDVYAQKMILKGDRVIIKAEGYDLLNANIGIKQYISPNSIVRSQSNVVGRYYMLSMLLKFSHFHK